MPVAVKTFWMNVYAQAMDVVDDKRRLKVWLDTTWHETKEQAMRRAWFSCAGHVQVDVKIDVDDDVCDEIVVVDG